jgi:Ca-activated chloride channel family protein
VPIDPNGRFSTTYRPGRGHLAAFEAAVSRGIVPVAARQLVADVGARYAPDVAVPAGQALGYSVALEREAVGPGGGPLHVRVALQSTASSPAGRPRLSVHLVLDQSGSMNGEPIERAKQAAQVLVDRLAPTDEFSLISFSDDAEARVPVGFVGQRKIQIKSAIANIESGGGTNIGEALAQAYRQARQRSEANDAIPVVLLLSDGQPTVGERSSARLSARALEAFQDGIQTSTFGLGNSYDGNLMSAVASDGAGGYYYLRDSEQIGAAFRAELDQRLDPAATAVELRLRLDDGVELLHVYGSRRLGQDASARVRAKEVAADQQAEKRFGIEKDRQSDAEGGMRFFIPAFARDDSYALLVKVAVPEGKGRRKVGVLEIKYKDRLRGRNVIDEQPIEVAYAASDSASVASLDPSVARTVHGHKAGEDLLRAAWHLSRGDRGSAVSLLEERASLLRRAADSLDEPGFTTDAGRFANLLAHLNGQLPSAIQEPYALAMVLETAGRAHLR